ncbi:MAG: hypothetical protein HYZ63_04120 [Candidatus Andersenbacteria bacterium]|nr:hypothetical protein [Candidatus Andersenbacteria bacterium]
MRTVFPWPLPTYFVISLCFLVGTLLVGTALLWTQQHVVLGELHTPHEDTRTLHVKPGREFRQTFVAEGRALDGVILLTDPALRPSAGHLLVTVDDGETHVSAGIESADIFPGGEVFISFSPPLSTKPSRHLTMAITSDVDVGLRYQIDGSKYAAGTLSLFSQASGAVTPVSGDIAFQARYQSVAADILGLSPLSTVGLTVGLLFGWVLFVWLLWLPASPGRFQFRWTRMDWWALLVLTLVVGAAYGFVFFRHITWWSPNRDYVKDVVYLQAGADSLRTGSLPVWDMNMCGGQPLLGNAEGNTLSVGTLLSLATGPVVGMKIWVWFGAVAGAIGAYCLARLLGVSPWSALLPAFLVAFSAFVPNRAPTATTFVAGAAALPWMFFTFIRSLGNPKWLLACATITATAFFAGDTHVIAYGLIALSIMAVFFMVQERRLRPGLHLVVLLSLLISLGAVKILPVLEGQMHYHGKSLPALVVRLVQRDLLDDVFFSRLPNHEPALTEHGNPEGWDNIGLYVGMVPVVLALVGFLVAPTHVRFLFALLVVLFLVLGEGTFYDEILRRSEGLKSLLRFPSRSLIVAILVGGISGGYVIDWLRRRFRLVGLVIGCGLIAFVGWDLVDVSLPILRRYPEFPPSQPISRQSIEPMTSLADVKNPQIHPLSALSHSAMVSGECPDFNVTPEFAAQDYEGPIVTRLGGSVPVVTLVPNGLQVVAGGQQEILQARMAFSPLLDVHGAWPVAQSDGSLWLFVPAGSSPVTIRYTSSVMIAGIIISLGSLAAWLLLLPKIRHT